ncbi:MULTISPECIES: IclR family transcriptional regulator [Nonomuraea]|uniref:IclR family transcriptional regulator n=1 Tax=Nonomuraea ferruginea TaxID=46174 RepID=A0ABT4T309_9ACTN|nr:MULTISPECIES: IclR family transcriptional regulator [Nonomuraea]MDA0643869.1 IclR family transcriptional regulator [Nonomuraea ferruginea]TXK38906.1 IclR family transcriptional regulator [Nonomuraea sp. C10]
MRGQASPGTPSTSDGEPVGLLDKASAILEILAQREWVSAAELAETLGEPRSTIHRLLRNLASLGWVESGTRGQWGIGLHLFRLGSGAVRRMDVRRAALPHMQHLHDESGETVFLCIRRGLDAVCVERLDGRRVQSLALQLGGSMPLHLGAGPMAILAFSPEDVYREWLLDFAENGSKDGPTAAEINEEVKVTRQRGYAVSDQNVTPGIAAVGAPVFNFRNELEGALSVSGLRDVILDPANRLAELTVEAAERASRDLGWARPAAWWGKPLPSDNHR